jgi:hypothetical protein
MGGVSGRGAGNGGDVGVAHEVERQVAEFEAGGSDPAAAAWYGPQTEAAEHARHRAHGAFHRPASGTSPKKSAGVHWRRCA